MAQIVIRNLSDRAMVALRHRARLKGTSLEGELRRMIEREAPASPAERVAAARAIRGLTNSLAAGKARAPTNASEGKASGGPVHA